MLVEDSHASRRPWPGWSSPGTGPACRTGGRERAPSRRGSGRATRRRPARPGTCPWACRSRAGCPGRRRRPAPRPRRAAAPPRRSARSAARRPRWGNRQRRDAESGRSRGVRACSAQRCQFGQVDATELFDDRMPLGWTASDAQPARTWSWPCARRRCSRSGGNVGHARSSIRTGTSVRRRPARRRAAASDQRVVVHRVRHVRQVRLLGLHSFDRFQGLLDAEVRRVRACRAAGRR